MPPALACGVGQALEVAVGRSPTMGVGIPAHDPIRADVSQSVEGGQLGTLPAIGIRLAEDPDLLQHLHPQEQAVAGDILRILHLADEGLLPIGTIRVSDEACEFQDYVAY